MLFLPFPDTVQNDRFTEHLRQETTSWEQLVQASAQTGSASASRPGPCPLRVWWSLTKDRGSSSYLSNLCWYLSTPQEKSVSLCSDGISWFLIFVTSSLPVVGTTKSLAPSSSSFPIRYLHTLVTYRWIFSFPGWTVPVLSAFHHWRDASFPSSSLWPCAGLIPVYPNLSCTGHRTGDVWGWLFSLGESLSVLEKPLQGNEALFSS